ncbi:MAG TPA: hypothetical protein VNH13_03350 [Candidatus Acidoferrales bacterium]|nr:hypothetical protein [Candidatus Acidoferrales bacterium]
MRHLTKHSALLAGTVIPILLAVAACGPGATTVLPTPTATAAQSLPPAPTPTPVPGPSATPAGTPPAQTDTAWGRIWEGLPAGFPAFPGAEPTETGAGPASATLDIPTSAGTITDVVSFYRSALETAGYSVSVDGPLENGGYTIDATGAAGCAAQVSAEPLGSSLTVTVLYGAACPFE